MKFLRQPWAVGWTDWLDLGGSPENNLNRGISKGFFTYYCDSCIQPRIDEIRRRAAMCWVPSSACSLASTVTVDTFIDGTFSQQCIVGFWHCCSLQENVVSSYWSEWLTLLRWWVVCAGRMYRCVRCPTAYHANDLCIAAGSEHLTGLDIVCSKHFTPDLRCIRRYQSHLNVGWCFVCSKGLLPDSACVCEYEMLLARLVYILQDRLTANIKLVWLVWSEHLSALIVILLLHLHWIFHSTKPHWLSHCCDQGVLCYYWSSARRLGQLSLASGHLSVGRHNDWYGDAYDYWEGRKRKSCMKQTDLVWSCWLLMEPASHPVVLCAGLVGFNSHQLKVLQTGWAPPTHNRCCSVCVKYCRRYLAVHTLKKTFWKCRILKHRCFSPWASRVDRYHLRGINLIVIFEKIYIPSSRKYVIALPAHDDLRILCDFTFYVPHSTSDDASSLFVMFFARTIRYF